MKLKITTPDKIIYQGDIKTIIIPTENGLEKIDSNHTWAIVTAIKPGLIKISPETQLRDTQDFVISNNEIIISISKGMAFIDGTTIRIVSSQATTVSNHSKDHLEQNKSEIEHKIKELKRQGSIEQIELYMTRLQKINADIALEDIKQCA